MGGIRRVSVRRFADGGLRETARQRNRDVAPRIKGGVARRGAHEPMLKGSKDMIAVGNAHCSVTAPPLEAPAASDAEGRAGDLCHKVFEATRAELSA